jgi:hypothetical protein
MTRTSLAVNFCQVAAVKKNKETITSQFPSQFPLLHCYFKIETITFIIAVNSTIIHAFYYFDLLIIT